MLDNLLDGVPLSGWTLRRMIESISTYDEALAKVQSAHFVATEYIVLSGVRRGHVVARDPASVAHLSTLGQSALFTEREKPKAEGWNKKQNLVTAAANLPAEQVTKIILDEVTEEDAPGIAEECLFFYVDWLAKKELQEREKARREQEELEMRKAAKQGAAAA